MTDRYYVKFVSDPCSSGLFAVIDGNTGQAIKHYHFRSDAELAVAGLNSSLAVARLNSYELPKGVVNEQE